MKMNLKSFNCYLVVIAAAAPASAQVGPHLESPLSHSSTSTTPPSEPEKYIQLHVTRLAEKFMADLPSDPLEALKFLVTSLNQAEERVTQNRILRLDLKLVHSLPDGALSTIDPIFENEAFQLKLVEIDLLDARSARDSFNSFERLNTLSPASHKAVEQAAQAFHYSLTSVSHNRSLSRFVLDSTSATSKVSSLFSSQTQKSRDKVTEAVSFWNKVVDKNSNPSAAGVHPSSKSLAARSCISDFGG